MVGGPVERERVLARGGRGIGSRRSGGVGVVEVDGASDRG